MQLRTIVVGVADPGAVEDPTMEAALQLAETARATLHVVHAAEVVLAAAPVEAPPAEEAPLAALESRVRGWTSYPAVVCHSESWPAAEALRRVTRETGADLLVVGAGQSGRFLSRLLGSTTQSVVGHPAVPTLVVRAPFRRPIRAVLLTSDLSEIAGHAHRTALELVDAVFRADAPDIHSLLVVGFAERLPAPLHGSVVEAAQRDLTDFLRPSNVPPHHVTGWVRQGEPVREITTAMLAWRPDLVVVGTHSPRGLERLVLGSVAAGVVRAAPCNVLVVPGPEPVVPKAAAASAALPQPAH